MPDGSNVTGSPTSRPPFQSVPVTRLPKPCRTKIRSIGSRVSRPRAANSTAAIRSSIVRATSSIPSPVLAEQRMMGLPSKIVPLMASSTSASTTSSHSASGVRSVFVSAMKPSGTCSKSTISMCSRVWGITPSSAAITSMTRSMPPTPASICLTKRSCPGTSTTPMRRPEGRSMNAKPSSIEMPRFRSSGRRSVLMPLIRSISAVFPWSIWPAVPSIAARVGEMSLMETHCISGDGAGKLSRGFRRSGAPAGGGRLLDSSTSC